MHEPYERGRHIAWPPAHFQKERKSPPKSTVNLSNWPLASTHTHAVKACGPQKLRAHALLLRGTDDWSKGVKGDTKQDVTPKVSTQHTQPKWLLLLLLLWHCLLVELNQAGRMCQDAAAQATAYARHTLPTLLQIDDDCNCT
jgi:hypothetical protein